MHLMHMFQMHSVSCKQHIADIYILDLLVLKYEIYIEVLSLINLIIKEKK